MFFDIHAHVYRHPVPFVVKFCDPDELLRMYDRYGIEKGCLLPVVNSEIYLPQSNEDILEIAAAHPDRFIPFCNVDPRRNVCRPSPRRKNTARTTAPWSPVSAGITGKTV